MPGRRLGPLLVAGLVLLGPATVVLPARAAVVPAAVSPAAAPAGAGRAATVAAAPRSDDVRRAVDAVLSRRAYREAEPSRWQRWWERVRTWVAARLLDLVAAAGARRVGWTVVGAATLVALLVAWRLVRTARRDPSGPHVVPGGVSRRAVDWEAASRAAERRGDLREAVRAAYRGALARLAASGRLDEVPGRTVGEYRRDVARAVPEVAARFAAASDVVEEVLYAGRTPTAQDLRVVRDAVATPVGAST